MKEYTLTIYGKLKVLTENFDDIRLDHYSLSDLDNLIIENVQKDDA